MTAQILPADFNPPPVREFTPEELALRHQAQQVLLQRRREAVRGPERLRTTLPAQPPLFRPEPGSVPASSPRFASPPRPAPAQVVAASLEAAIARVRQPRPGSPAARAVEAVERARPVIEGALRRRDARHNALTVLRVLTQAAYTLIEHRGQLAHATTYTFFTVMDLLPVVTSLSSDQCERATRKLQELGLIHKTSGAIPTGRPVGGPTGPSDAPLRYRGGTWTPTTFLDAQTGEQREAHVCAGTWVAVLLHPAEGRVARVRSHTILI